VWDEGAGSAEQAEFGWDWVMISKFGFTTKKLGDVSEAIFSGGTPSTKNENYWGGDIPWLSSGETRDRFISETEKTITQAGVDNSSTRLALKGDIVIASAGQGHTRGQTSYLNFDTYINQSVIAIRAKADEVDSLWLFYNLTLRYNEMRQFSDSHSIRGSLTTAIIKTLDVNFPQLEVQKKIASSIYCLDNKIALNRQINQTLESMAQTIFKSWFVDFDPVKAKIAAIEAGEEAEGVTCAAMRAISGKTDDELGQMQAGQPENYARLKTTARLFPSAMQDSELGEVPEGWEVKQIGDVVKVVGGGTPSTKNSAFWDGGSHCWTTPKDLSGISSHVLLDTVRKITDAGLAKISCGLLPAGTFLLSSRAPVGYTAIAKVPLAVNQGYIAIPPGGQLSSIFLLHWTRVNLEIIKGRACGTTFQEISKKNFRPIKIAVATTEILNHFDRAVGRLFERIVANEQESRSLTAIRDALLPKLMSGKIRVK